MEVMIQRITMNMKDMIINRKQCFLQTGKFGAEISVENALDVSTAIAQISEDTTTNLRVKGTIFRSLPAQWLLDYHGYG